MLNHTHIKLLFRLLNCGNSEDLIYAYFHSRPSIYQACTIKRAIEESKYELKYGSSGSDSYLILSKLILILAHTRS